MNNLRSASLTPRIARMLRELEGPPRNAANDVRSASIERGSAKHARRPSRRDAYLPAVLAVGGAVFLALAAWQAWELASRGDAQHVTEATSRR